MPWSHLMPVSYCAEFKLRVNTSAGEFLLARKRTSWQWFLTMNRSVRYLFEFSSTFTRDLYDNPRAKSIFHNIYTCTTLSQQPNTFLRGSTSLWESRRVIATYTRVNCELWPLKYEKHTRKEDIWVVWYK